MLEAPGSGRGQGCPSRRQHSRFDTIGDEMQPFGISGHVSVFTSNCEPLFRCIAPSSPFLSFSISILFDLPCIRASRDVMEGRREAGMLRDPS